MDETLTGEDDRPEQLRPPVVKAEGSTDSERYLAKLADKSFLNLWSYPNPYRDQRQGSKGDGKELCDLLVVCGRHIIIFSEKTIKWPSGDTKTAWRRWAKRAIRDSASQTKGAERWISEFPKRIYLDRPCKKPFPISLPLADDRQVHRVVIANGSAQACKKEFPGTSGSLKIVPSVVGPNHWSDQDDRLQPFTVGDIDPHESFVHVFNESALDIVMEELDTISDFTNYLTKKAEFIRSGKLSEVHGEENLLAYYVIRTNIMGDHDFVVENESIPISINHMQYGWFVASYQYRARKNANKVSYQWDRIIEVFSENMFNEIPTIPEDSEPNFQNYELCLRYMALVSRLNRRAYSKAFAEAVGKGKNEEFFIRILGDSRKLKDSETVFFILMYKYLGRTKKKGGYKEYRSFRAKIAMLYSRGLLIKFPNLKRVIGIALNPVDQSQERSEKPIYGIVYAEQSEWSAETRSTILKACEVLGILKRTKEKHLQEQEFPDVRTLMTE